MLATYHVLRSLKLLSYFIDSNSILSRKVVTEPFSEPLLWNFRLWFRWMWKVCWQRLTSLNNSSVKVFVLFAAESVKMLTAAPILVQANKLLLVKPVLYWISRSDLTARARSARLTRRLKRLFSAAVKMQSNAHFKLRGTFQFKSEDLIRSF